MINAAIVGLGWWGKALVNAVQGKSEQLRFVHGVSKEPEDVGDFAREHDLILSTELEDALADPRVQAVVLATPHSQHLSQIEAVAAAGKPVFCEKPLALTRADAIRAVDACRKAGVPLGLGHNKRFWPSMRKLKQIVASGELGEILHIEGHLSNENSGKLFAPWRDAPGESPGGGMTGSGLHVLDAIIHLAGPVRLVHGRLVLRKQKPDPQDTVSVLLELANGITGTLSTVRATPYYWRVHVFGRNGSAESLGENELVLRRSGAKPELLHLAPVDSLLAELEAFAGAVTGGDAYPIMAGEMIDTVAAFEAIIKSIGVDAMVQVAAA